MLNLPKVLLAISLGWCLLLTDSAVAQNVSDYVKAAEHGSPSAQASGASGAPEDFSLEKYRWLQEEHRQTELIYLMIAMIAALVIVLYFLKLNGKQTAESIVNGCGLVLVVFGTLYIAVCAATSEQLTAPMGILGAIAGYLFGTAQARKDAGRHEAGEKAAP